MIKCDLSGTYTNETEKIIKEINKAIKCIDLYYKDEHNIEKEKAFYFINLIENVKEICNFWTGNFCVGIPKENEIQKSFQIFFEKFMELLLKMKTSEIECEKDYANNVLYQGKLYRYLSNKIFSSKSITIEYNDIYVSWSKREENFIKSKMYYPYKKLTCIVSEDKYGIDIEKIGSSKYLECEVVFPTKKDTIINVEEVFDNYKEDEDE